MSGQFVASLISPLGTSLLFGGVALILLLFVRASFWRRPEWVMAVFAFSWLWIWSMPVVSDALRGRIEGMAGPRAVEQIAPAETIVVLGGGVSGFRLPLRLYPDLGSSSDRVWYASRLYKAGKGQRVVLSGGVISTGDGSEAEAMHQFLLDLGVPDKAIMLEATSGNTIANARKSYRLLSGQRVKRIILVTSALHMLRARRIFERAGFRVIPAPTDFEVIDMPFTIFRLLPDADALEGSARAMKELVGYVFAR
jgi:uncharacterized SAM-binding protein YcdF (DUF218 family)